MKDKSVLNYYDRQEYEQQMKALDLKEFRTASRFLSGETEKVRLSAKDTQKKHYRITPESVSTQADFKVLVQRDQIFNTLQSTLTAAGIVLKKGTDDVTTPIAKLPHIKEVTLGAVSIGKDNFIVVTMTNAKANRLHVLPTGKLHYREVETPHDGDVEKTIFYVRAVRKLEDGGYVLDTRSMLDGIEEDVASLGKLLIKVGAKK